MKYRVERAEEVDRDLETIVDFLVQAHLEFGESSERAWEMAGERLRQISAAIESLGDLPHQGTLLEHLRPGLRSATRERAVFYFKIDEDQLIVRVLAVYFGGQDHQSHIRKRLS